MPYMCALCQKNKSDSTQPKLLAGPMLSKQYTVCPQCYDKIKALQSFRGLKTYQVESSLTYIKPLLSRVSNNEIRAFFDDLNDKIENYAEYSAREERSKKELHDKAISLPVTTADIHTPYEIIAPIIFTTTNRGVFSSAFTELKRKYEESPYKDILVMPTHSPYKSGAGLGVALGSLLDLSFSFEGNVGHRWFDLAFYMCVAEMKMRAIQLGGDAIIGMHLDFDLDTTDWGAFYLQMYGTVVKFN